MRRFLRLFGQKYIAQIAITALRTLQSFKVIVIHHTYVYADICDLSDALLQSMRVHCQQAADNVVRTDHFSFSVRHCSAQTTGNSSKTRNNFCNFQFSCSVITLEFSACSQGWISRKWNIVACLCELFHRQLSIKSGNFYILSDFFLAQTLELIMTYTNFFVLVCQQSCDVSFVLACIYLGLVLLCRV